MRFEFTITCENDAFQNGNRDLEVARLLRLAANQIEQDGTPPAILRDNNGNRVGGSEFTNR